MAALATCPQHSSPRCARAGRQVLRITCARAVQPRVVADLPAGARARRVRGGSRRRAAPPVRRPGRGQRLGCGGADPLRVRSPVGRARDRGRIRERAARAAARHAGPREGRARADREGDREADRPARTAAQGDPRRAARPRHHLRADRDRLPDGRLYLSPVSCTARTFSGLWSRVAHTQEAHAPARQHGRRIPDVPSPPPSRPQPAEVRSSSFRPRLDGEMHG